MKIGFSYSLCVQDILDGKVAIEDVVVIIARTKMDTEDMIKDVSRAYVWQNRMKGDPEAIAEIGIRLHRMGKLFQPRLQGITPVSVLDPDQIWMDLMPTLHSENESVQQAWRNYQLVLKLAEGKAEMPEHLESPAFYAGVVENPKQIATEPAKFDDNF